MEKTDPLLNYNVKFRQDLFLFSGFFIRGSSSPVFLSIGKDVSRFPVLF